LFVLLLAGVFAVSTYLHVVAGDHAVEAAWHMMKVAEAVAEAGAEPGSPDEHGPGNPVACALSGSCAFCVPRADAAADPQPAAAPDEPSDAFARIGETPAPLGHPPRPFASL
jgi:hypothetical protein